MNKVLEWLSNLRTVSPEVAAKHEALLRRMAQFQKTGKLKKVAPQNESEKTPVTPAKNNDLPKSA